MSTSNLDKTLDKTVQLFANEAQLLFNGEDSSAPATKEDLFELSKRVAYALDDFKKAIVKSVK